MQRAYRALTAEEQALVTLFELEGWSIAELSNLFDKPEGTIKAKLFRARRKMREEIDRYLSERRNHVYKLLAQVQDKYFRVEVDASGKTDAEIAAEIASNLEAQGLGTPQVTVMTGPNGAKQLSIEATADPSAGGEDQVV